MSARRNRVRAVVLSAAVALVGAACGGADRGGEGARAERAVTPLIPVTVGEGRAEPAGKPESERAVIASEDDVRREVRRGGELARPAAPEVRIAPAVADDAREERAVGVDVDRGAPGPAPLDGEGHQLGENGMLSSVGEALPVRPEGASAAVECVCPVETAPDDVISARELRELRREARWRFPESSAVQVAGGPPRGFERQPGTPAVYGRASVGGFDRDPRFTDGVDHDGTTGRDANY